MKINKKKRFKDNITIILMLFENKKDIINECELINRKCLQRCECYLTDNNDIIKYCDEIDIFKWESDIYLSFIDDKIFPNMDVGENNTIIYKVNGLVSLRSFLIDMTKQNLFGKNLNVNVNVLLNELFSYIKNIKRCGLIHGNLHVDNLFVKKTDIVNKYIFFTIDYTNSYNKKHTYPEPRYSRTSFIGEYDDKIHFDYWDFFTLYISLKYFFLNNKYNSKYITLLEELLNETINEKTRHSYIEYIIKTDSLKTTFKL